MALRCPAYAPLDEEQREPKGALDRVGQIVVVPLDDSKWLSKHKPDQ